SRTSRSRSSDVPEYERRVRPPVTERGGHGQEGRGDRGRGPGRRAPAERDVPRGAGERTPGPRTHQRQDASALHPDPPRGPGGGRAVAVRPDPRPHRLPLQVTI